MIFMFCRSSCEFGLFTVTYESQLSSGSVSCRRKLPVNPNTSGVLTDKSDYSYLDGRPAEIGLGVKRRLEKNREYAVSRLPCSGM
jgi:hypothetical protein